MPPPPPPPATTSVRALVTPPGTRQPPTRVRYERGNVTTVFEPLRATDLMSVHDGLPYSVALVPLAADAARLVAIEPAPSLKSKYPTNPLVEVGPHVCISVWICAAVRTTFHRRTSSICPGTNWAGVWSAPIVTAAAEAVSQAVASVRVCQRAPLP